MEGTFFALQKKEWESEFFSFPIASLRFEFSAGIREFIQLQSELQDQLTHFLGIADAQYDLLEIDLDAKQMFAVPLLEEYGFRLVDSKCRFLTLLEKEDLAAQLFDPADERITIREKTERDFESITALTVDCLVNDDSFLSRYKNVVYFGEGLAEKYFLEWIRNAFHSPDALVSVAIQQSGGVVGFFIYERKGTRNQLPVYKGILSVVRPEFRGAGIHLALQSCLFRKLDDRFYVDNTTQLANTGVIRNHIKSRRSLERISLVFFRRRVW